MNQNPERLELPIQSDLFAGYGGSVKKQSKTPLLVGGVLVVILCIILGFISHLFVGKTLPFPDNTIALLYLSPRTELPQNAPRSWRDAKKTSNHFPIFVGYVQSDGGTPEPFEITAGTLQWKLRASEHTSASMIRPQVLPMRIRDFFKDAWLGVWPTQKTDNDNGFIVGPIQRNQWKTSLYSPVHAGNIKTHTAGFHLIDLKAFPDQWHRLKNLFITNDLPLNIEQTPSVAEWKMDDALSVALRFDDPISSSTQQLVAAASGIFETRSFRLPDGTVGLEERVRENLESSDEHQLENDRVLRFSEQRIYLGHPDDDIQEPLIAPCDGKPVLALFDESIAATFFYSIQLPRFQFGKSLYAVQNRDKMDICW